MTTRPKQANNKNLEFKNDVFARMQRKGQSYMMIKDTTCKTKRYHIKINLALANVPLWHYGFKPCFLQVFHTCVHKFRGRLFYKLDTLRLTSFQAYHVCSSLIARKMESPELSIILQISITDYKW